MFNMTDMFAPPQYLGHFGYFPLSLDLYNTWATAYWPITCTVL